ncbi:uncharacterized protein EKO05_0006069 [Ascochyta rabiei]|uniref:Uncharacterized protein n=1 Tax=Didymella rabiei TaxID=5454 RepID=A0A163IDR5_DIDRA|nr:uncharacterized protein EKO05_0006069 [Ascochyta rabiei]KZM25722.1 hypothetical protein ST47_g3138 [Ascochyta rabiei]UPX15626.1 hypothetical protein EKO05_0006069 [Ascochyta rabiei]
MSRTTILAALTFGLSAVTLAADPYPNYEYGNMFYLGPTTNGQYITKATYSLSVPAPPTDYLTTKEDQRWLALWIGLQNNPNAGDVLNMDFVQPLVNWGPNNEVWGCPADNKHWCATASTYTPTGQIGEDYVPIPSNTSLDFVVEINSSTGMIDQSISMGGSVISKASNAKGMKPAVFYSGTECYADGCGTLDAHSWDNITLVLNEADAGLDKTLALTGATSSGMKSVDGGKTWTVEKIVIEKQNLTE